MTTNQCQCGSYAINPILHGRTEGIDLNLCDVCYWRKRASARIDHDGALSCSDCANSSDVTCAMCFSYSNYTYLGD